MVRLIGISYSPWTERARWCLDHHRIRYDYAEYTPLIGELGLRMMTRRLRGRVSVPVIKTTDRIVADSYHIALYTDRHGAGDVLIQPESSSTIVDWVEIAEEMLSAGRHITLERVQRSKTALEEALPGWAPEFARSALRPVAKIGVRYLMAKYRESTDAAHASIRDGLARLSGHLSGGRRTILDSFSFADIAVATAMQVVSPRALPGLGPASRALWANEDLAREFSDVVEWRDRVYEQHR